jgi:hypothetical protein
MPVELHKFVWKTISHYRIHAAGQTFRNYSLGVR